jgi:formylmethanofuran dehydrogenase subunit E
MERIICKECGTCHEEENGSKEVTEQSGFLCGSCYEKLRTIKQAQDTVAYKTRS